MSVLQTWPSQLPAFSLEDYVISADGRGIVRTAMSSGEQRQRRRYRNRDRVHRCSLKCSAAQTIVFKHFFDELINEGANPFIGVYEDPLGRQVGIVQIVGGAVDIQRIDKTKEHWRIAFAFEVKDDMTAREPVAIFLASLVEADVDDMVDLFAQLAITVNDNAL